MKRDDSAETVTCEEKGVDSDSFWENKDVECQINSIRQGET